MLSSVKTTYFTYTVNLWRAKFKNWHVYGAPDFEWKMHNTTDFELKKLKHVRIWIKIFWNCQKLEKLAFKKPGYESCYSGKTTVFSFSVHLRKAWFYNRNFTKRQILNWSFLHWVKIWFIILKRVGIRKEFCMQKVR